MNTALWMADSLRVVLVTFLSVGTLVFTALLILVVVQRALRARKAAREAAFVETHQPLIDRLLQGAADERDDAHLGAAVQREPHRVGRLLVAPLALFRGMPVNQALMFAQRSGLECWWRRESRHEHWWRRSEAVRSLGLIHDPWSLEIVVMALDDPYEEVRAAAVGAAGRLADPRAARPLLARLLDESRHQRVRVIDALHQIGHPLATPLAEALRTDPHLLPHVAQLVPAICGSLIIDDLRIWTSHDEAPIRVAALQAIGDIGADDDSFYYVLRALSDDDAGVRAMAARALGRSGRDDAASYLGARLTDEWSVAAESAQALAALHDEGRRVLTEHAASAERGADLAQQVLWQQGHRTPYPSQRVA